MKNTDMEFKVSEYTNLTVGVKKLSENAKLPYRKYPKDSGADLFLCHPEGHGFGEEIKPFESKLLHTGISFNIPESSYMQLFNNQFVLVTWEMQIRSKSGLASKENLFVLNSPGTVDNEFIGEIKVILYNAGNEPQYVFHHDKIAQAVLCPVMICDFEEVDELQETDRSNKGFGSTGYQ